MNASERSAERVADHFVNYLFDTYRGSRHVRRVASWVGFVIKAIERVSPSAFRRSRMRQLTFTFRGREFKARYNHKAGRRGGIEIVEVLPGRGAPDGAVVAQAIDLAGAEALYHDLEKRLNRVVTSRR